MKMQKNNSSIAVTAPAREDVTPTEITATLEEQMSSGVGGTVDIGVKNNSSKLVVTTSVANAADATASIVAGTCQEIGQEVYLLGALNSNPKSFEIDGTTDELISKLPLAVVVQDTSSKVLACGNLLYEDEEQERQEHAQTEDDS